ncbi:MAG TPA: hypothetical protein VHE77_08110 [Dongiaceae bacterium]|nr:hypothetical protein [Dongiaceae bacterium]
MRTLGLRDYAAILIVAALLAAFAAAVALRIPFNGGNGGFGPDWNCSYAGQGDPVCIKKSPSN